MSATITITNTFSRIDGLVRAHCTKIRNELSVRLKNSKFVIRHHLKNVHPWTCACGYKEPRDKLGDYARLCPRCGGTMVGHRSWCWVCNGEDIASPVQIKHRGDGSCVAIVPSGLIYRAKDILTEVLGVKVVVNSKIVKPDKRTVPHNIKLRDYQEVIVDAANNRFRGTWQAPTGSGKTIVALAVWALWGHRGLIVVPTQEIQEQFYTSALEFFDSIDIGAVGGNAKRLCGDEWAPGEDLTIGTYQIFNSKLRKEQADDLINNINFILVDEGHHLPSRTIYNLLMRCDATIRYAQSATLTHNDLGTLYIEAATGPLIASVSDGKLIKEGYKARPVVRVIDVPGVTLTDYKDAMDTNIYNNDSILAAIRYIIEHEDGLIIIMTTRKSHMRRISLYLQNRGIEAHMICGETKPKDREEIVTGMRTGDIRVVVATQVFDEGIDIPDANVLILAGGGKSIIKHKQRIGRVLRPKKGENVAYIYDFYVEDYSHAQRHSSVRLSRYEKWGWKIERISADIANDVVVFTPNEEQFIETGKVLNEVNIARRV